MRCGCFLLKTKHKKPRPSNERLIPPPPTSRCGSLKHLHREDPKRCLITISADSRSPPTLCSCLAILSNDSDSRKFLAPTNRRPLSSSSSRALKQHERSSSKRRTPWNCCSSANTGQRNTGSGLAGVCLRPGCWTTIPSDATCQCSFFQPSSFFLAC